MSALGLNLSRIACAAHGTTRTFRHSWNPAALRSLDRKFKIANVTRADDVLRSNLQAAHVGDMLARDGAAEDFPVLA